MSLNASHCSSPRQQRGFLLPLALFIMVALGTLALSISTLTKQSHTSSVVELTSIQALLAAESGSQRALQALLFNSLTRSQVDAICIGMNVSHGFNGVLGLEHCSAQVSCRCLYTNGAVCNPTEPNYYTPNVTRDTSTSAYHITSSGQCGSGGFTSTRDIEVGAMFGVDQ